MMDFSTASPNRIKSACEGEVTPITLSRDEQCATFAASDGSIHTATLEECTCTDFFMNLHGEQPCKHMIRLAMELGVMDNAGYTTSTEEAMSKLFIGRIKNFIKEAKLSDVLAVWPSMQQLLGSKGLPGSEANILECIGIPDLKASGLCQTKAKDRLVFSKDVKKELKYANSTIEGRIGSMILENMEITEVKDLIQRFYPHG